MYTILLLSSAHCLFLPFFLQEAINVFCTHLVDDLPQLLQIGSFIC